MLDKTPPAFMNAHIDSNPQSGLVPVWSFSTLDKFESCPYSVYLSKVEKIKTESSEAASRGELIHDQAEAYVRGELDTIPKTLAKHYEAPFEELLEDYEEGIVTLEEGWGYNTDWEPLDDWFENGVWARLKLDAYVAESDTSARVIDYKSGRPYPIKHNQQGQLYAIGAFARDPNLEFVKTEFWYVDKDPTPLINSYTRKQAMYFLPFWTNRARKLTQAKEFHPNPSTRNCRFCDHSKSKTCPYRVA